MGDTDTILNKFIGAFITALVGTILLISAFLPVAVSQINSIADITGIDSSQITQYQALFGVVVVIVILVLIIGVVRYITTSDR